MLKTKTTRKITVANPEFRADRPEDMSNRRHIEAVVSLRESSVVTMASHGLLSADQVAAAWRFRHAYDQTMGVGSGSNVEPRVVGTRKPDDIAERRLSAAGDMRTAKHLLGAHGFNLVTLICAEGFHIRDIYKARRERDTATDMLKIHLSALASVWRC